MISMMNYEAMEKMLSKIIGNPLLNHKVLHYFGINTSKEKSIKHTCSRISI
jgi:hypothetical protein